MKASLVSTTIPLNEASRVGEARRTAVSMAEHFGLNEQLCGRVAIIATELANNLIKHAVEGKLHLRGWDGGVELLAIDKGPGMRDVSRCFEDGFSTAGTPGTGLGAVKRLSTEFDIFTQPGKGTVLMSQVSVKLPGENPYGVVSTPAPGETECGDSWGVQEDSTGVSILTVDGLGHGPMAAQASRAAVDVFDKGATHALSQLVQLSHGAMRATRGAALALARVDWDRQTVIFCGVGNIQGAVALGETVRRMVSYNGTVGHQMHKVQEFLYPFERDAVLVMHSDGLTSNWNLMSYPGLLMRHPSVIAGIMHRDFLRGRDDATVVVLKRKVA